MLPFAKMFLDGRRKTMIDRRVLRPDTNTCARSSRRSSIGNWFACSISSAGPFDMLFICQGDEVTNIRRLYASFWRYRKLALEVEGFI